VGAGQVIVGVVAAVEAWVEARDLAAEYAEWEGWYAEISAVITRTPGVTTRLG
jgi:hypothetical protein